MLSNHCPYCFGSGMNEQYKNHDLFKHWPCGFCKGTGIDRDKVVLPQPKDLPVLLAFVTLVLGAVACALLENQSALFF